MQNLSPNILAEILRETFPKQNDYGDSDYREEYQELLDFGIETRQQLVQLIEKHKDQVLSIDSEDLDEQHIKWYREDSTIENLDHKIENKYWFTLSGLLRIALELEFKDAYVKYSNVRDGI